MKKKKYLLISLVIIICILTPLVSGIIVRNKNNIETPINYLLESINNRDINTIPKAFHEYCSLCIEQNISNDNFDEYINGIIKDFGKDYKLTYQVVNTEKLSNDELKTYETNAIYTYSNYPYLSKGNKLKFDDIYKVTTDITIKGNIQTKTGNVDFLIVKIDGKFYFLHTANQLMSMFINY